MLIIFLNGGLRFESKFNYEYDLIRYTLKKVPKLIFIDLIDA